MSLWQAFVQERRYLNIVFFVFALFITATIAESLILRHATSGWDAVRESKTHALLADLGDLVKSIQRETRRISVELAHHPLVVNFLLGSVPDSGPVFELLSGIREKIDLGLEVYDASGRLRVWDGVSGHHGRDDVETALKGQLTSYVATTGLYSQLMVLIPVWNEQRVVGVILVRRVIEAHYPLNNRYITWRGLTERARDELGVVAQFEFSRDASLPAMSGFASEYLYGIDNSKIGTVTIPNPTLDGYEEEITGTFRSIKRTLLLILTGPLLLNLIKKLPLIRSVLLRSLVATFLIWSSRYLLLWLDIPSIYYSGGPFDPAYFASPFGAGLAKSIGDLTLTSIALLFNVVIISRYLLENDKSASPWWHPRVGLVRWILLPLLTVLLFLLFRGYGATVRSAVFDSALMYTDPTVVLPSFELGLMVVNLFIISFCLIVVAVGLTSFLVSLMPRGRLTRHSPYGPWVAVGLLFLLVGILFEVTRSHPVVGPVQRILFAGCVLFYTAHLHWKARHRIQLQTTGSLLTALGLAAVFFYPLLAENIQEKDRKRVEVFASEFLRPIDSWLRFVVEEALHEFQGDEVRASLLNGDQAERERIAMTLWARSTICREGYSSLFMLRDSTGASVSQFSIGNPLLVGHASELHESKTGRRAVRVEQQGAGVDAVKVYHGTIPILENGRLIGSGAVVMAAGQQTLFRGENPSFLRSPSPESIESFYRPITVAEFRDGRLFAANNKEFPEGFMLPSTIEQSFNHSLLSFWGSLDVGKTRYEAYFVRRSATDNQVIALCLPEQDLFWHLFSGVKMLLYYSLVVVLVLAGYLIVQWIRGTPYRMAFRDKLLVALLATAVFPLLVIAYAGKIFAESRLVEETAAWLERETDFVAYQILQLLEEEGTEGTMQPEAIEAIAGGLGTDFNFYVENSLQSTSRPELYAAGLLDRRLSGSAYSAVVVRGQKFHHQSENVGRFRYAVGYRRVMDEKGVLRGVVSVPTLYRQDELDRQVSTQNALLFGIYSVVLFLILGIATTLANRIASPIHRLTEATRRVARGELDIGVRVERTDGEIGELVRSFDTMLRELKESRDELVRYERELAWKEMAKQVAHEIKNPLTPMKLSLQHLRQTYEDKVAHFDRILEEVTRTVIDQIDGLGRIATEFSRFGRMPRPSIAPCDVNEVLEEAVHLFDRQPEIMWERTLDPQHPLVLADHEELRRAFINVLRNGIQAMGGKGLMKIGTSKRGREVVVTIRDYGPGIPDEIKGKLFEPNFSTKTEGMGLGLAIVKNTIDNLKGKITIESQVGKGAEVVIVLPAATDKG